MWSLCDVCSSFLIDKKYKFTPKHAHTVSKTPGSATKLSLISKSMLKNYFQKNKCLEICSGDLCKYLTVFQDDIDQSASGIHPRISAPEHATVLVPHTKSYTEGALSQLYTEVQAMPPGPKKRRLMKQVCNKLQTIGHILHWITCFVSN